MITFKYNNKQYTTNNLENKLNKLGITKEDIEILGNRDLGEIDTSIKKYYFKNIKTGEIPKRLCTQMNRYILFDLCKKQRKKGMGKLKLFTKRELKAFSLPV